MICDEPISSLDVSIQAQIVNLLRRLQREFGLTYLFISHDLSMVRYITNRMAVMYLGKIVELGESKAVCGSPLHPYTQALWSAVPIPNPTIEETRERIVLEGDVPSPTNPPPGCNFSHALPARDGRLPRGRARAARGGTGTAGGVPSVLTPALNLQLHVPGCHSERL